jgi:hypothetical protein
MTGATRQIQITVRLGNLVASSHWDGAGTVVNLVTEDAARTGRALTAAGFDCESCFVVLVEIPDKPGLSADLADRLRAAGIEVLNSYAFRSDNHRSYVVFQTSDDDRAIYLLEVDALIHHLAASQRGRPSREREPAGACAAEHAA